MSFSATAVAGPNPPHRGAAHGKGRAFLKSCAHEAIFSELSYRYPLKLLSPLTHPTPNGVPLGIAYVLSYGGGLVSGDNIDLEVEVDSNCALMLLTQGSTKVYKTRPKLTQSALGSNFLGVSTSSSSCNNGPPSSPSTTVTTQHLVATLKPSSCLFLLPDPVTCFASSSYSQTQTFHLPPIILASPSSDDGSGASAIILDWFTSGRMARNEEWAFERYKSCNEIWIGERRVARDVMLLEQHVPTAFTSPPSPSSQPEEETATRPLLPPPRTLHSRLAPYACYATLFLIGSQAAPLITSLSAQFNAIQQMQATKPDKLLWALSPLNIPIPVSAARIEGPSLLVGGGVGGGGGMEKVRNHAGAIVRVMGMETELVREWLKSALSPLRDSIGADAYQTAFI